MKYYAFLRAINIGKRRVKMDALKQIFVGMGFENVSTYIASGNVIFESQNSNVDELTTKIESTLLSKLGYEVDTFIKTTEDLNTILENNPFQIADDSKQTIYITFLSKKPSAAQLEMLLDQQSDVYRFKILDTVLYTLRTLEEEPSVFSNNYIEKILDVRATTRNLNTIQKIKKI